MGKSCCFDRQLSDVSWEEKELSAEVAGISLQNAFENVHFPLLILLAGEKVIGVLPLHYLLGFC